MAEVVLDGLWAQEQLSGCGAGGVPLAQQECDLELLWSELVERAGVAAAGRLARGGQFGAGLSDPRRRPEALEDVKRRAQLFASLHAPPRPS